MTAAPDSVDQNCVTDQLVVSGGTTIPAICGTNTGQHSKNPVLRFTNIKITITLQLHFKGKTLLEDKSLIAEFGEYLPRIQIHNT